MKLDQPALGDPTLLEKIDQLIKLGVGKYVSLPQLVVVGDQSSGKSSLLEGLTKLPFPRDSTLCTRFPTRIVFRRTQEERVSACIIPADPNDANRANRLRSWNAVREGTKFLTAETFKSILDSACAAMNVPRPGPIPTTRSSTNSAFAEDILQIELAGPTKSHFSVIDVPGLFRTPTQGVTNKSDIKVVESIVRRFITDKRTIILAVLPANVDIATQEILELAQEVDPKGARTLGVLTKLDLVEPGTEDDIINLVSGNRKPLKLGYCMVRNRKHQELNISSEERHQKEAEFFQTGPFSGVPRERTGISSLHVRLQTLLRETTRNVFPDVRRELDKKLFAAKTSLEKMGPSRTTEYEQRVYLMELANSYQTAVTNAISADYCHDEYLKTDGCVRLATCLVELNTRFSSVMARKGHAIPFKRGIVPDSDEEPARKKRKTKKQSNNAESTNISTQDLICLTTGGSSRPDSRAALGTPAQTNSSSALVTVHNLGTPSDSEASMDENPKTREEAQTSLPRHYPGNFSVSDAHLFAELDEILDMPGTVEVKNTDIYTWLAVEYRKNRGFELGNFNSNVISSIFQKFTKNWTMISRQYIIDSIKIAHRFSYEVLQFYAKDSRSHLAIWENLLGSFKRQYVAAMRRLDHLLDIERNGTMTTTNHHFNKVLEKYDRARKRANLGKHSTQRLMKELSALDPTIAASPAVDALLDSFNIAGEPQKVQIIHDVLKSYYTVARERFVDVVFMQVTDYHLVTGAKACLKIFDSQYVLQLSSQQLEDMAGEDSEAKERRAVLKLEIEALNAGKRVIMT